MSTLPLDPGLYREVVRRALAEDLGWGDLTSSLVVPDGARAAGTVGARGRLVLAGLDVAIEAFRQLDPSVTAERKRQDGEICRPGETIAVVRGLAAPMLTAERTALNFLRHLSGVASVTRWCIDAGGGTLRVADTRKTLPLLRTLQQYAVRVGGGVNHRMGLFDAVMLKENHIHAAGSITAAVAKSRSRHPDIPIIVEVETLDELREALATDCTRILIDDFSDADMHEAVRLAGGRKPLEVSGGVTWERLAAIAAAGVDFVSVGALTKHIRAIDFSMRLGDPP